MRELTKIIKVYQFDELSKDMQTELIEKRTEKNQNFYCDYFLLEDMEEKAKNLLKKNFSEKATFKKVYYDLSYSQGSGAMIEFDLTYYNKDIQIKHNSNYYYHENTFGIIENYYNNTELTEKQFEQLKKKIYFINCELSKFGYSCIEYFWSDDAKREAIGELQEFEFTIDGEQIEI